MSRRSAFLNTLFVSICLASAVGCGSSGEPDTSGDEPAEGALTTNPTDGTSSLGDVEVVVAAADKEVSEASDGQNHITTEDMPSFAGDAVAKEGLADALAECAIYGGGLKAGGGNKAEDATKYFGPTKAKVLATKLAADLEAAGKGTFTYSKKKSFGIGDPGVDFTSKCTVAVKTKTGAILAMMGRSDDVLQ